MICFGCMEEISNLEKCPSCGYLQNQGPKEAYHLYPGSLLVGHYIVGKTLGYGGFGVTYIGYDKVLNRKVAIKEYMPSEFATRVPGRAEVTVFNDAQKQEQFEKGLYSFVEEGSRLAKFNGVEGIVSVYDSFIENSTGYIVMEYLEGITLKDYLKQCGSLSYEETLSIMTPIFNALAKVHEVGIIHRDIAPDNIMITIDNRVNLIDFGASRFATTSHSKSLSVILKLGYAPEEQYRSRGNQGPWSDVYALCATMYQMMSGKVPQESIERASNDQVKLLSKLGVKIDSNAETTLMNGLNIRAENRVQSVEELQKGLEGKIKATRIKEKGLVEDIGQWPKWLKIFVPTTSLVAATLALLMMFGVIDFRGFLQDTRAEWISEANSPNLVNLTLEEAQKVAEEAGFQIGTDLGKVENDYVEKDVIISQNPESGTLADKTEKIQVLVSAGPKMMEVTRMIDTEAQTRKKELEEQGFVVVLKEEVNNKFYEEAVVSQSVSEDTQYGRKGKIVLTVAKNEEPLPSTNEVEVPNVVGKPVDEARDLFYSSGIYLRMEDRIFTEDESEINSIVTQEVRGRTRGASIVNVTLSKGVFKYYVPDVTLKTKDEATKLLTDVGSKNILFEEAYHQSISKGQVISQSVDSGVKLKAKDEIKLTISKGPDKFTIPSLYNMSAKEAENLLISLQIPENIIKIDRVASEEVHSGNITSQSIEAGGILNIESTILLTESTGGVQSDWVYELPNTVNSNDYEIITEQEYRTKRIDISWTPYTSWQSSPIQANDNTKVNARYRSQSKETTTSTQSNLSGYTQFGTPTKTVSTDCTTSTNAVSTSSTTEVSTFVKSEYAGEEFVEYEYYGYYGGYVNSSTGKVDIDMGTSPVSGSKYYCTSPLYSFRSKDNYPSVGENRYSTEGYRPVTKHDCGKNDWFISWNYWYRKEINKPVYKNVTYYKSCPIITTYNYFKWTAWTGWANGNPPASNDNLNVEVQYQSSTKKVEKEANWSEWSRTPRQAAETLEVETRNVYRYRFK